MARSLKKGLYVNPKILKKVKKAREEGNNKPIRVWDGACVISPEMIGMVFEVYNGKTFNKVSVTEFMVGHRLGEFISTTKWKGHSKKGKVARAYGSSGRYE